METSSLEVLPTKAEEDTSPHEMRLPCTDYYYYYIFVIVMFFLLYGIAHFLWASSFALALL